MRTRSLSVLVCLLLAAGLASAQLETFDGAAIGTSSCGTTNTGFPYNGWMADPTVGTGNLSWIIDNNGTGSTGTGPTDDVCGGGNYVFTETSCGGTGPFITGVLSPVWSAAGLTAPTLNFYLNMFGTGMGTLDLQASDGVGGWTSIYSIAGDQGANWFNVQVPVPVFDIGMGPQAQIRFVGTRGADFTSDMAFDQVYFGDPAPPSVNQGNLPNASLTFSGGMVCQAGLSCNPTVPPTNLPEIRTVDPTTGLSTMTVGSGANLYAPYAVFYTPGFGVTSGPGLGSPFGIVDFAWPASLPALTVLIDGIGGLTLADQLLGTTLGLGTRSLTLTLPPTGTPGTTLASFQALVVDPTSPNPGGLQTTQATELFYAFTAPPPPPPPAPPCALPIPVPGVGDDSTTQIVFTGGLTVPFYGAVYTDLWVNSNGSVTFGAGSTDLSESAAEMLSQQPRIAGVWDDLNPTSAGAVNFLENANSIFVSWEGVPQFGQTDVNDFCIQVYGTGALVPGLVSILLGQVGSGDNLVGISPGGIDPATTLPWSPVGVATGASIDFSTQVLGVGYVGTPTEAIFQLFTSGYDLGYPGGLPGIDPCNGAPTGGVPIPTIINFTPNPTVGVLGDMGYTGT